MQRREFIALLGGAAIVCQRTAWAQQSSIPVVGLLGIGSIEQDSFRVAAFKQGLREAGYVDGRNVKFEYRSAENQPNRLPELASDLVHRRVAAIAAIGVTPAALAAKAATTEIPVVFAIGGDPVKFGLVASLDRPGGNLTGVSYLVSTLVPKQFEIISELVPDAKTIGFLFNPRNPNAESETKELEAAVKNRNGKLVVANASAEAELPLAFESFSQHKVGALCVEADWFLVGSPDLIALSARHALPAIYSAPELVAAGGLMSYGNDRKDAYRTMGAYAARILNGEKPGDLPVQQSTKVQLAINLKTAKALGLSFPVTLLGRADEVIE
jgi:putative ABC transport system substrate-binding protein